MTDCAICGRVLPIGGVLDDVGRPVHYVCKALARRDVAELARVTVKRVAKEGPSRSPRLPQEVFPERDTITACAVRPSPSLTLS